MWPGSLIVAVLATYVLRFDDWAAPAALRLMGFIICFPAGVVCFCIAVFVRGKPPEPTEDKTELFNGIGEYQWKANDDEERKDSGDHNW